MRKGAGRGKRLCESHLVRLEARRYGALGLRLTEMQQVSEIFGMPVSQQEKQTYRKIAFFEGGR